SEKFFADLERDQRQRATMSMLITPQMLNTIATETPASSAAFTDAWYADPVRRYMLPVFSDRQPEGPSHPYRQRDSVHGAEVWAVEGLTHRYPTKVLAELLPTCPQYCGHCTRMDLVGNPTATFDKHKFGMAREDRLTAMLDYLRRSPGVRDVVGSGGDVADPPWPRLGGFVSALLQIESGGDIRPAAKALVGLPPPRLARPGQAGGARAGGAGRDGAIARRVDRDPHPRERCSVGDADGGAGGAGDAGHRDQRRAQPGRAAARRERRRGRTARPVLRVARRRRDHALLLLHVRHDPGRRALAADAARGAGAAGGDHGLPARVRDATGGLRRAVRRQAVGAPGGAVRRGAWHFVLDEELPDRARGRGPRRAGPGVPVLRPDPLAAGRGTGLVALARPRDS